MVSDQILVQITAVQSQVLWPLDEFRTREVEELKVVSFFCRPGVAVTPARPFASNMPSKPKPTTPLSRSSLPAQLRSEMRTILLRSVNSCRCVRLTLPQLDVVIAEQHRAFVTVGIKYVTKMKIFHEIKNIKLVDKVPNRPPQCLLTPCSSSSC